MCASVKERTVWEAGLLSLALGLRDVTELMASCGVLVTYETTPMDAVAEQGYADELRWRQPPSGNNWPSLRNAQHIHALPVHERSTLRSAQFLFSRLARVDSE